MKIGKIYKIISAQGNECYVGSTFNTLRDRFKCHKYKYKEYKKGKGDNVTSYELFDKYGIDNCRIVLIKEYEVCDRTHMEAYETLWINRLKSINKFNPFRINKFAYKQYYEKNKDKLNKYAKEYREQNKDMILYKSKQWREQNKDKVKEQHKQWREHNKEILKEKGKQKYIKNKEKVKEYAKEYREQNKDKVKEQHKQWHEQNKEILKEKGKQKYIKNKEKVKEYAKQWREQNKDKIKENRKQKILCKECNIEIRRDGISEHKKSKKHMMNITKEYNN